MVPTKKPSRKTKRTPKKVKKPVVTDTDFNEVPLILINDKDEPIEEHDGIVGTKVPVKTSPEPVTLQNSEETAWTLLDARPKMPYITSVEDAVAFADKYARWNRDVEGTKRN